MNQTQRNKWIGLLILVLGALGFFFFFGYFHLDGVALDRKNISLLFKMILTTAFLPISLYSGIYFISGKKVAIQIGGGAAVFLILAFIFGFLFH